MWKEPYLSCKTTEGDVATPRLFHENSHCSSLHRQLFWYLFHFVGASFSTPDRSDNRLSELCIALPVICEMLQLKRLSDHFHLCEGPPNPSSPL